MDGYQSRPAPILVVLFLLLIVLLYAASALGFIDDYTPEIQPNPTQLVPNQATPVPTNTLAPTPDATLISQSVEATVAARVEELEIKEREAKAAAEEATAEQDKAEAVATITTGQIDQAKARSTQVAIDGQYQTIAQSEAETRQNTMVSYAIIILSVAASSGILAIALGLAVERHLKARQRRDEAAARLLHEQAKLGKNTAPLRGPEKSYQDAPTIGIPHPKEDGSTKEHDCITKDDFIPERRPDKREK